MYVDFKFKCPVCSTEQKLVVTHMDPTLFTKEGVTRATWCTECRAQVAFLYKFTETGAEFIKFLSNEEVSPQRPVETGITVRPRASKKH